MNIVCIRASAWPHGPERPARLAALALCIAPRIRMEPARFMLWADARGLDAGAIAGALLQLADDFDWTGSRAGVASTPIAAEVAARPDHGADAGRVTAVPSGGDRGFLAPFDVGVLTPAPPPSLYPILAGVGIECCGDLARLDRESVEVRFGAEGVRLWQLARAEDDRLLFVARRPEPPRAELEWVDYELERQEQVVFIVHSLLGSVCDELSGRGEGAHAIELEFALADRTVVRLPVRSGAATADRRTWLRIILATLDPVTFGAPVMRIALQVEGSNPLAERQGDLFDPGFASSAATEAALAHLLDKQADAIVSSWRSNHPLPERRLTWVAEPAPGEWDGRRPEPATLGPSLSLQLFESPRPIEVRLTPRRDAEAPVRYREGGVVFQLRDTLGPDRVSGGYGEAQYDREYFQGIRSDGVPVLFFRDLAENRWYLAGWWD